MAAEAVATVHTTGVNWESILVIIGSTVSIMSILGTFIARYISSKITEAINKFQVDVVSVLTNRLTHVETLLQNVDTNNPARSRRSRGD